MRLALGVLVVSLLLFFVVVPLGGGKDVRDAPVHYWTSSIQSSALLAIGVLLVLTRGRL